MRLAAIMARTYGAGWQAAYQGILPSSCLAGLCVERSAPGSDGPIRPPIRSV